MKKITLSILILLVVQLMSGQTINLDTNFGTNGIKRIAVTGEEVGDYTYFFDLNDTNSFLICSKINHTNSAPDNIIYKLNTNGTFDTSFGTNGKIILPNYYGDYNVFKQGDSFIVFFSRVLSFDNGMPDNNERVILRYTANGVLDTSFGTNGEVRVAIGDSDGSGISNIIILNDNSILFSDPDKFIKYTVDGSIDTSYGTNGVVTVTGLLYFMTNSNEGNIFFHNESRLEKLDYNGNLVNSFGTNGSFQFDYASDYILKTDNSKLSLLEIGGLPAKFYDLNNNGTYSSFNSNSSLYLTSDSNSLDSYEDFTFSNGYFYFVGIASDTHPFIVCYDESGNLINLNNAESYKEPLISGYYSSVIVKGDYLYACGDNVIDGQGDLLIAKYSSSTLSTGDIHKDKISYQNPVGNNLIFSSENTINSVEIYNLIGQKVGFSSSNSVNTSYLKKGTYIAEIVFDNGNKLKIKILKR